MQLVTPAPGTFTTQELERLAVYRAAVAAGFYTDAVPGHEASQALEVQPPASRGVTIEELSDAPD